MPSRSITVTPDRLSKTSGEIKELSGDYESQYKQFFIEVDGLVATWTGKDNKAFAEQVKGFEDDFQKMKKLMDDYASFLDTSAKSYIATQEEAYKQAKSLKN